GQKDAHRGPEAVLASLQALAGVLDPYCGLTVRREFQRLDLSENTPNAGLEFVGVPLGPVGTAVVFPGGGRIPPSDLPRAEPPVIPAGPLRVLNVQPGSPGQKAGVRPGDLITRINGHPPESPGFANLFQRLRPIPPGTPFNQ